MIAQLGPTDMKGPVGFALNWPERRDFTGRRLDFARLGRLDFARRSRERGSRLRLAREVMRSGGSTGAVFNAGEGAALRLYRLMRLAFLTWRCSLEHVLEKLGPAAAAHGPDYDLAAVMALDAAARDPSGLSGSGFQRKKRTEWDLIASIPVQGLRLDGAAFRRGARDRGLRSTNTAIASSGAGAASMPRCSRWASAGVIWSRRDRRSTLSNWPPCRSAATQFPGGSDRAAGPIRPLAGTRRQPSGRAASTGRASGRRMLDGAGRPRRELPADRGDLHRPLDVAGVPTERPTIGTIADLPGVGSRSGPATWCWRSTASPTSTSPTFKIADEMPARTAASAGRARRALLDLDAPILPADRPGRRGRCRPRARLASTGDGSPVADGQTLDAFAELQCQVVAGPRAAHPARGLARRRTRAEHHPPEREADNGIPAASSGA